MTKKTFANNNVHDDIKIIITEKKIADFNKFKNK